MSGYWIAYLCLGTGLASAIVAGVFLAFSDFIMRALTSANPIGAVESMQEINLTVLRSFFLTTFFLLIPATIGLSIHALLRLDGVAVVLILAGTVTYLLPVIAVTIFGNVPMNTKLAQMEPNSPDTIAYWRHYGTVWTRLNHLRTAGSMATAATFLVAAIKLA